MLFIDELLFKLTELGEDKKPNWYNVPISYPTDFMKGITPIYILALIWYFNASENPNAWAYFGSHGSYGILWMSKNYFSFGDKSFHKRGTLLGNILGVMLLSLYLLPPYLLCSAKSIPPFWTIGVGVFMYGCGVFWHFVSDMQKYVYLEFRSKLQKELGTDTKLVDNIVKTKLWAYSRNPNYFGELLIYTSFCILSYHWISFASFASIIIFLWLPFWRRKDASMSRHGLEYQKYKNETALVIPGIY
mmetsp:Transcript_639/g.923  ORF Transcript_639/g.923 Transcript_639/m.923 type:complete len:246 (+) Transcript_639:66-803(+)